MDLVTTIPDMNSIVEQMNKTPRHMRPCDIPFAVIWENALSDADCDALLREKDKIEPYQFHGCNAITREAPTPLTGAYGELVKIGREMNKEYFRFALDRYPLAWFQEYGAGNSYADHCDGEAGQSRKLTAVALLSDEYEYAEGELLLTRSEMVYMIPKTRGTVVVFPPWMQHQVRPVRNGTRHSINMGWYGPPFQ